MKLTPHIPNVGFVAASCFLGLLIIATPPIAFVGSLLLTGAGHGTALFYDMYNTPRGLGFFLPSICAALVVLPRWKTLVALGGTVACLTLLLELSLAISMNAETGHVQKVAQSLPTLTYCVAFAGPSTCLLSIVLGLWRLYRQRAEPWLLP